MKRRLLLLAIIPLFGATALRAASMRQTVVLDKKALPHLFQEALASISYDALGELKGKSSLRSIDPNTLHVKISFSLSSAVRQDDWQITIRPAFSPSFHWAPHLTPGDRNVIDQHVFRSPALILADRHRGLMLIPDLDILAKDTPVRWYLDLDAPDNRLTLGMSNTRVSDHVLFEREAGAAYPPGEIEIGFYLFCFEGDEFLRNPFRKALDFCWNRWGHDLYKAGNPLKGDLEAYVRHTYNWAFEHWSDPVWQEFELNGKRVGAPVFIRSFSKGTTVPMWMERVACTVPAPRIITTAVGMRCSTVGIEASVCPSTVLWIIPCLWPGQADIVFSCRTKCLLRKRFTTVWSMARKGTNFR